MYRTRSAAAYYTSHFARRKQPLCDGVIGVALRLSAVGQRLTAAVADVMHAAASLSTHLSSRQVLFVEGGQDSVFSGSPPPSVNDPRM